MSDAHGSSADRDREKPVEARGEDRVEALLPHLVDAIPLRAGSVIVTLYGDVVEPRGGQLWMGSIIETCGALGLSETLVRTAVSRLVAAGQLAGERQGRRSFYRLTEAARREFLAAARTLFEPQPDAGWRFVWLGAEEAGETSPALDRDGFVRLAPHWWLGPAGDRPADPAHVTFEAGTTAPLPMLQRLVAAHWDLAAVAAGYDAVLAAFGGVTDALDAGLRLADAEALQLRLLLVHAYRQVALRDPRLPAGTLPETWSGHRARRLFADLYLRLSPAADRHVGRHFLSGSDALPPETPDTLGRLASLARIRDGA